MSQTIDIERGDDVRVFLPQVIYLRPNESKTIAQVLEDAGVAVDLTGWTVELHVQDESGNYQLTKSITDSSSPATVGVIDDPTNGAYYFTILAADIATILGTTVTASHRRAYVRHVSPATSPPRTLAIAEFLIQILPE